MTELKDLVGRHKLDWVPRTDVRHPFDPDANGIVFSLDGTIYLVFEDPSDGYRSNAGPILEFKGGLYELGGVSPEYLFEKYVLASHETQGEYGGENDILVLRDELTGHEIMRVGTSNVDDYYPSFVSWWNPSGVA
jgi:hypothetical protein